ncbi:hypothetical protein AB0B25_17195 [Nocardia sp. NPDC049190]|uniref:hypothetical protein n=1 Tax=Nocardia sp. NPDC049190 TaxID=3155650 RepID=UPI0033C986C2
MRKFTVAGATRSISQNAVQLHGAMGTTEELANGHYFQCRTVFEHELGSSDAHLAPYAAPTRPRTHVETRSKALRQDVIVHAGPQVPGRPQRHAAAVQGDRHRPRHYGGGD